MKACWAATTRIPSALLEMACITSNSDHAKAHRKFCAPQEACRCESRLLRMLLSLCVLFFLLLSKVPILTILGVFKYGTLRNITSCAAAHLAAVLPPRTNARTRLRTLLCCSLFFFSYIPAQACAPRFCLQ